MFLDTQVNHKGFGVQAEAEAVKLGYASFAELCTKASSDEKAFEDLRAVQTALRKLRHTSESVLEDVLEQGGSRA